MKKRIIINRAISFVIFTLSFVCLLPLFLILSDILKNGIGVISIDFLVSLPKPVGEEGGGIVNAIFGTVLLVLLSSLMAVPVGVGAGIYLSEKKDGKFVDILKVCIDILQGVPSIVLGIVAYVWVVKPFGRFSAFSGSVALAIMMLPAVVSATEETLKMIPFSLKEAGFALGAPYWRVMLKVIIPAGISGIITGILIGISRISGETAPLLFTSFGSPHMNLNPMKPCSALPLLIFNYALSPYPEWINQAWGASVILCFMVFFLNLISKISAKRWKKAL